MDKRTQEKFDAVTDEDFQGYHVKDMPWVRRNPPNGRERDIDEMLKTLDKRIRKSGRLEEFEENQYFTSDSKERREARRERDYKLKKMNESPRRR